MKETIIDLIRHGEPVGGRAYRGHNIDDPLSEKGWQQMWQAVGDQCPWQQIISSPLSRCLSFARALAEDNQLPVETIENFKEVGFGSWEGLTPDQIKEKNLAEYTAFYQDPVHNRPPGAEDLDEFYTRVNTALDNTVTNHQGKHILVVAHAGVIRAMIARTLHASRIGMYKIKIENAGISRIRFNNDDAMLEFVNGILK